MSARLPHPDAVLRAGSCALLAGVAASGFAWAAFGIDAAAWLHWGPECALRAWTGLRCPGCGMGHALVRLGQGAFADAWAANPAAAGLLLAAGWAAVRPPRAAGRRS